MREEGEEGSVVDTAESVGSCFPAAQGIRVTLSSNASPRKLAGSLQWASCTWPPPASARDAGGGMAFCADLSVEETNISPSDETKMMRVLQMSPHNGN